MNERAVSIAKAHNPNSPGKFEAEPAVTVYFWECMMDGDGDYVSGYTVFPDITTEERALFPELKHAVAYMFNEDEYGFIWGCQLNQHEYDAFMLEAEGE